MIYHELYGQHLRLGNWLFKYAWSIAKKEQFGEVTMYPENYYLWQYLKVKPNTKENCTEFRPNTDFLKVSWEWSPEEMKRVDDILINGKDTLVSLDSFFQSERWFENYKSNVRHALRFSDKVESDIIWKYGHLFTMDKKTIGIGIRLGDFVGHGDFYQIPGSWYILALNEHFPYWKTENEVVIFSDDIEGAKRMFAGYEYDSFKYAEPNNTHTHNDNFKYYHGDASEQLILGSLCQPAGTKIETLTGKVNIEDLKVGDSVISYSRCNSKWVGTIGRKQQGSPTGRKINSISEKDYSGKLIKLETEDRLSLYTPDHICMVKMGDALLDKTLIYLMRKGNKFRVGISSPTICKSKSFDKRRNHSDIRIRLTQEKADEIWILDLCDTKKEASWKETLISNKYRIPQVRFVGETEVEWFWDNFGDNVQEGISCLADYNRDFKYPFYTSKREFKLSTNNVIQIRACNLLNGMKVLDYDKYNSLYYGKGDGFNAWISIKISLTDYIGKVYSMDVDINNTYFGDGVLTHNCNNFIIGNSTFSWWQAWLATYNSGKVVHCGKVFSETGNMKHIDTSNYYCKNWIKHEC